jgi:HAD superfamily phosphatase (TIGR01668 family)
MLLLNLSKRRRSKNGWKVLKVFFPEHFYDSIYEINLDDLIEDGIKAMILDLDNTIIARNSLTATDDLKSWLLKVEKAGIKACILSNNWKQRVETVASQINLPLVARAAKPRKGAFKRALKVLGTHKDETVVVGDQIFTDVFGANMMGLRPILVLPMSNHEAVHTRLLRYLERLVMKRWQRHRTLHEQGA